MKTVNMHEAKTHLSRLVDEAAAGVEIVIARAGKPVVRLVAISATAGPRQLGALAGKVVERKGAWGADRELEALFYQGGVEPARARRVAESRPKPKPTRSTRKKK